MKVLAAIDIGTNSVRLEVVRVEDDGSISTLTQQKQSVRLGEGEFESNRLTPSAIERGTLVCARFVDVARGFDADELVAFATSAVREAENQQDFLDRVKEMCGLEVRIISGPEEARLIYLGVASGANLGERRALFIDIGGGSTELILGDAQDYFLLDSMKLGSIRLANRFLAGETGPITSDRFAKMKQYVRGVSGPTTRRMREYGFDLVYGSAGTITNLAEITARRLGDAPTSMRNYVVRLSDLQDTAAMLCRLPLKERREVPGMDADRADIILGGAAVLLQVLEDARADAITISDRGLRNGIILDALGRTTGDEIAVRRRSVLQLGRACNFDEPHAHHVTNLALSMFDQLRRLGRHPYGKRERELLEYGALLHDIGMFLSHTNHQKHAYYLIRHSDLLGFDDTELNLIANLAFYHRKSSPKKKHANLEGIGRSGRRLLTVLASILQLCEGLDRSHLALVKAVRFGQSRLADHLTLTIVSEADCQLEIWGVQNQLSLFEQAFGCRLDLRVEAPPIARAPITEVH